MKLEEERVFAAQAGDFRHARAEANHLSGTAIFASASAADSAGIFASAFAGVFAVNFASAFAGDSDGIFAGAFAGAAAEVFRNLDAAYLFALFLRVADENIDVAFLSEGNQVYK